MTATLEKPLKAYQVDHYEGSDEGSVVVFATNSATARREGGSELGNGWEDVSSCRRVQAFDQYAPGPVPIEAQLAAGWYFHCDFIECQRRIEEDGHVIEDEYGDEQLVEGAYVIRRGRIFCTQACLAGNDAYKRARVAAEAALLELVEAHFPGCTVTGIHIYGDKLEVSEPGHGIKCLAYFTFPGGSTYPCTYHFGDGGQAYVPQLHVEAFESLYRKQQ